MNGEQTNTIQNVTLCNRESLTVTGVREVLSYDEAGAIFDPELGKLCVDGENIALTRLDLSRNEADITGKINALAYIDKKAKGLFGKKQ